MAISKRLRFEILRRDNHACRYCGATAPDAKLTVDHVIPEALGGSDEPTNLVAACTHCNSGKSSVPPDAELVADVATDAFRWSLAMQEVAAIREQEIEDRRELLSWFNMIWHDWSARGEPIPAPEGFGAVVKFVAAGLTRPQLQDLVRVAMQASHVPPAATWRYFCGCCWRRIRENADMAADLLKASEYEGE